MHLCDMPIASYFCVAYTHFLFLGNSLTKIAIITVVSCISHGLYFMIVTVQIHIMQAYTHAVLQVSFTLSNCLVNSIAH